MLKRIHERVQSKLADAEVVRDAEANQCGSRSYAAVVPSGEPRWA
jgi:hypothetical protein